jgi:MFS family permease
MSSEVTSRSASVGDPPTAALIGHPNGSPQRKRVLTSILLAYFYDSYDLFILSLCMASIIATLGINYAEGGLLSSASMLGAAVGSIIFGILAENRGKKFTLVVCLLWFGIGTGLVLLVDSWLQWMILRFLTCLAIGGVFGPAMVLIRDHWAPKFHIGLSALMVSIFAVAAVFASLLARLVLVVDWRILFLVGTTAIIVAAICQICIPNDFVRKPKSATPKDSTSVDTAKPIKKIGFKDIFRSDVRKITLLALTFNIFMMAANWGFNTWVPTFIVNERGVDPAMMTNYTLIIYGVMFFGYQVGAFCASKIGKRRVIFIAFLCAAVFMLLYLIVQNGTFLFFCGPLVGFMFGAISGVFSAFCAELYPNDIKAFGSGFCFNFGRIGSVIAPFTIGMIADNFGLGSGLIVVPIVCALAAATVLILPESYEADQAAKAAKTKALS